MTGRGAIQDDALAKKGFERMPPTIARAFAYNG